MKRSDRVLHYVFRQLDRIHPYGHWAAAGALWVAGLVTGVVYRDTEWLSLISPVCYWFAVISAINGFATWQYRRTRDTYDEAQSCLNVVKGWQTHLERIIPLIEARDYQGLHEWLRETRYELRSTDDPSHTLH